MNKLSSSVLHLAATAAIATSGDVLANTNDTTTARIVNTKSPEYVNVTETTKKRIADLQKNFPQFKIDPEVLSCIKNELIDAECEPTTIAVADAGENMIKIEAKKLELLELTKRSKELDKEKEEISKEKEEISKKNAELDKEKEEISKEKEEISKKNAELVTMNKIGENIDITMGLVQLGLYVEYNQIPSSKADSMDKVNKNKNTPDEVISLFREFLDRKKNNDQFTWKGDGERLINMAKKYLDTAIVLESEIENKTIKEELSKTIHLASLFYESNIKMLNKNYSTIVAIK